MQDKRYFRYLLVFMAVWLILLTAIPTIFYTVLPLDTVETIMWSHPFSMGNAKHPPLAAWLAGLFTVVFAHTDFAMYLLSQLMLVIGFVYMYRLGREFFGMAKSVLSVVLLATILFYSFDSAKFNVNLPHMALWPMMTYYCLRGVKYDRLTDWILFGFVSALSVLSKFFGFALLLSLFVFIVTGRETRKFFRRPGPYLAFAVFLLALTPYLVWLVRNNFPPLMYLSDRVSEEQHGHFLYPLTVLAESLYPIAIPLLLMCVTVDKPFRSLKSLRWRSLRPSDPVAGRLALCVQFVPIALMTALSATGMMIDLMWGFPVYFVTGFFLMAFWKDDISPAEFRKTFWVILAVFVSVQVFDVFYWFCKTRLRGHFCGREFAAQAETFYRERTGRDAIPLAFGEMWYAGCVMQYLPSHPYAGSFEDPYDEVRFRKVLDEEGALGIFLQDKDRQMLSDSLNVDIASLNPEKFVFRYSAPYGKEKERQVFFVVIPPRNTLKAASDAEQTPASESVPAAEPES